MTLSFFFCVRGESVKRFADERHVPTFISHLLVVPCLLRRLFQADGLFRQTFSFIYTNFDEKSPTLGPSDARLYTKLRFARAPPASFSSSLMDCQRASFRFSFNGKKGWYLLFLKNDVFIRRIVRRTTDGTALVVALKIH